MFQYGPYLEARGLTVVKASLFDSEYIGRLNSGQQVMTVAAHRYLHRIWQILQARPADLLWVEKEMFPWMPWLLERTFFPGNVPVVTDYDDAVFHRYDLHDFGIVRRMLGRKIDKVMAHSSIVLAGNGYLADRARAAGAERIEFVPTVVDINHYAIKRSSRTNSTRRIGWIGSPGTYRDYLAPLLPLLERIAKAHDARILVVGGGELSDRHPLIESLPWSEENECSMIQDMDLGIMPLSETPWTRGKCGYKLIQYMACGLPVVASPVGVNSEIVEHGVNGFLASSDDEWRWAIGTLLADPDLRRRMGAAGRKKIERDYSLQVWGPRVAAMLLDLITPHRVR